MTAVSTAEARATVLQAVAVQPALRLPLADAPGHLLAEDVAAPWPLPPWTASSMDGYAVRAADVRGASTEHPIILPIGGTSHAGDPTPPPLPPGVAWRVATGGRVPVGADTVIRQEDTRRAPTLPEASIEVVSDRDAGRNVRPRGGDVGRGEVALSAGAVITPGVVAMLAALGVAAPLVLRRPRVGILASGDEVVPLDHPEAIVAGERLADVNSPMLAALVAAAGGVPVPLGVVPDDPARLQAAVDRSRDVDLLLTAGGVSVGEHDHVPAVMAALTAAVRFRRARIRPGGPVTFAVLPDGRPWLALPGNPVSAFVTFHLFARPAIRRMMGDPEPVSAPASAVLAHGERVTRHPSLDLHLRCTLDPDPTGGPPVARLTGNQGSWLLSSISRADGLLMVAAGEGVVGGGDRVPLLRVTGDG